MPGWATAASAVLACLLYYNTLDAGFVYDDRRAILSNPDVIGHTSIKALFENDFWGTPLLDPGSHGSYRPLCVATYRFNYAFSAFKPWSYHLFNIFLHIVSTILVVAMAIRLLPSGYSKVGSIVAGLFFAAHPIHTEAVAGIVGRADLASCIFFLLSFLTYTEHVRLRRGQCKGVCHFSSSKEVNVVKSNKYEAYCGGSYGLVQHIIMNIWKVLKNCKDGPADVLKACSVKSETSRLTKCKYSDSGSQETSEHLEWFALAGTLLFAIAATLCKELGIMVLPLCVIYDLLNGIQQDGFNLKRKWRSVSVLVVGWCLLLFIRLQLTGMPSPFAAADNPASRDPAVLTRFYTFAYLPVFNFLLLLYPYNLSFDWSMESVPRITTLLDPRNLITAVFYIGLHRLTWQTLIKELKRSNENPTKEIKYYKKQNSKTKHNWSHNLKSYNRHDCAERKGYLAQRVSATSKRMVCPCVGCKFPLTEDHTTACRAINNNNLRMHHSMCVCPVHPKLKSHLPQKRVNHSPQVALLMFIAFMVLPFVPASNILFYVGFVVAERVLYIPSVGFCLLLGLGASTLMRRWQRNEIRNRIFVIALLITLSAMCGQTIRRNLDWRDEESLFKSAVYINPPKAYGNLGSVLTSQGRNAEAEIAFKRALKHRPNMADVHYNLGILLQNQKRYGDAIKCFENAIYFRPSMALAYVNLGASLIAEGRLTEAANALRAGARADGSRVRDRREHDSAQVSALVQLAALHSQSGLHHKALATYKEALQILSHTDTLTVGWTRHRVLALASEVHVELQQWSQAEQTLLSALEVAPNHLPIHVQMAQLLAKNASRSTEAETWFKKSLELAPNDPLVHDHFGLFLRDQQRLVEASEQHVIAAELVPTDGVRAANAARALRDASRCRTAEKWYARAVKLRPQDPEYHSNLGAILHLNGKYNSAASSYRKALQLQPNDQITIINLKRLRNLINKQRHT